MFLAINLLIQQIERYFYPEETKSSKILRD
jgi:hypothetical protein